ncbi:MAG TPA: DUF2142 domain-containing protein [Candidatus Moranbacteria bacterium]|nr:DUF2142 domain-containing protein [Candidatus Moranbacteria bacterium]
MERIKFFLKKFNKLENIYLVFGLLAGLLMVFVMPPFEVPDENSHYYKSWEIAGGKIFCQPEEEESNLIPKTARDLPTYYELKKEKKELENFKFARVKEEIATSPDYTLVEGTRTQFCSASPLGHLPPAGVLFISRQLELPFSVAFYLARIVNLLISVFIIYFAIKITPLAKKIFLIIALFPIVIQETASLSHDAFHLSLSLLFIAVILHFCSQPKVFLTKKDYLKTLFISLVALNIKYGYFPLALLFLALPAGKFKNRKQEWLAKSIFVTINGFFFLFLYKLFQFPTKWPEGIDVSAQMKFVLLHPLEFFYTVINSLNSSLYFYWESMIGVPGPFREHFPVLLYVFIFLGLFFFAVKSKEKLILSNWQRVIFLFSGTITFFLLFFILYLIWTPVGKDLVRGIQGRYLIIPFLVILLSFYNKPNFSKNNWWLVAFIGIFMFFTFKHIFSIYY